MHIRIIFVVTSLMVFTLLSKAQSDKIEIGTIDTLFSTTLNEKRPIWIYTPYNKADTNRNKVKYPVIYLLDGDWHFVSVVGMLQQLSYINGNTVCPEAIVVGIPITDRYRDMTPCRDSTMSMTSGGYENFISFINNELFPYIDSVYPTAPYRVLIGHSLGGLTVINTLIRHQEMFNSYIAIDPSMWWSNQASLKETGKELPVSMYENTSLFVAMANTMEAGVDTAKVRSDNTRNTLPIRSILELSDQLKSAGNNKLNYEVKYYPNENHGSIPLIATYDALHFIFGFYNLRLTKSDYADTTMSLAHRVEQHYENISEKMGYRVDPSENTLLTLGYTSLYLKNTALAEHFFNLDIKIYPDSFAGYDTLGNYYLAVGDKDKAIEMFKKALTIDDNSETREKLESIAE